MKKAIFAFLVLAVMIATGCGGGGMTPAVGKAVDAIITFDKEDIVSESHEGLEKVKLTIDCKGRDLFIENCIIPTVEISWGAWSYTKPLNWNIQANSSKSYELTFITDSDRALEPLSYVREVNQSTSATDWTMYAEVLSVPEAKQIGKAVKTCIPKVTYIDATCVNDKDGRKCTCSKGVLEGERCRVTEEVCETSKNYSGTIAGYLPGTVAVTDGSQKIAESEVIGILTGAGNGIINNGNLSVSFAGNPPEGSLILAMYLKSVGKLKSLPKGGTMKLAYGTLKLEQEEGTGFLVDSSKNVYGEIISDSLVFYRPLGFQGAPLVAYYGGEPYNAFGGEVIGEADGIKTIFNLRTRYANIKDNTIKVFTAKEPGKIVLFNKYTGELTVKFDNPPAAGEKIKASYVLFKVNIPIKLKFKTNGGDVEKVINFENRNKT